MNCCPLGQQFKSPLERVQQGKEQVKNFVCQYYLPVKRRAFCVQNCRVQHTKLLCRPLSASKLYPFVRITGIYHLKAPKCSSLLSAKVKWDESTKSFQLKLLIHDSFYLFGFGFFFSFFSNSQPLTKRNIYRELCDLGTSIAFHA